MHTPLASSRLRLYLLGSPRLEQNGKTVEPDTRKAIALLAYLALTGQAHSRDALAALFYPENDQSHARGALRRTLSALSKALNGAGLQASREQVGLAEDNPLWTDVTEFQHLTGAVRAHHPGQGTAAACAECLARIEQAAALYRGDFMAGFTLRDSPAFDDWQFFQAESLRREAAGVLERLAQQHASSGRWEPAITATRRWLALDPLVEDAHRALMGLYARSGQRNAALRQYQECARILDKELGVAPLEETQQLYHDILENRLQPPPALSPAPAVIPAPAAAERAAPKAAINALSFPLVGRGMESESLLRAYREHGPQGYCFALQGEAGIGKTRLAEDFLAYGRAQGASVLSARCYEGETNLALAPLIEILQTALREPGMAAHLHALPAPWLSEAARLLPGLARPQSDNASPSSPPGAAGQSLFYEGLRQVILAVLGAANLPAANSGTASFPPAGVTPSTPPAILFIDDLHWADEASLEFLAYLVRRLSGHPLFVLLAWRDEELPAAGRLRQLLAEAGRQKRAASLLLERLSAVHVAELARLAIEHSSQWRAAHPTGPPPDFSAHLYRESEGLPFFLVAYLEAPQAETQVATGDRPSQAHATWPLPRSAQDLLKVRLAGLDELSRQVLDAAAVIGRSFDFNTLLAAAGRSELETVTALETLLGRSLVRECSTCEEAGPVQFDFSHDKLRSLAYAELSQTRRRLLHRRVAEALADDGRRTRDPGSWAGQVTQHYRHAGLAAQAAPYALLAGEHARRLYANREALAYLSAALVYYQPLAESAIDRRRLAWLHEACGDLHTLLGDYAAALQNYHNALEQLAAAGPDSRSQPGPAGAAEFDPASEVPVLPQPEPATLARLDHKLGAVHQRRGDFQPARLYFQRALEQLSSQPAGTAGNPAHTDPPTAGTANIASGKIAASNVGTGNLAANIPPTYAGLAACILADLSLAAYQAGDSQPGLDLAQEALALARISQQPAALAQIHNLLGIQARRQGQPAQAGRHLLESLAAARRMDDLAAQAAALNNLALASGDLDDLPAAIGYSQQALVLCERLGDRHRAAALHNNLADLFHQTGDQAQSMQHLKQAVVIFAEIGGQAGDLQPEIWKLTEW